MSTARPKLLHLTHRFPFPPDKGDRIRTFHTLKNLAEHADVWLASLADEPVCPAAVEELENLCTRVAVVPLGGWFRWGRALSSLLRGRTATAGAFHNRGLVQVLRDWTSRVRFDAVLASASSMVPYLRRPELRDVPAVVDLVDVDSQKWFDYGAASRFPRSWLYRLEGRQLRRIERELPSWARAVLLTTPAEVTLYEQFAGRGTALAVENGVDLDYFRTAPPSDERSCVFVGALDYRPNVDAVCWFCSEVWPRLVQRQPGARLYVVGRRPADSVQKLHGRDGVEVVGAVPDVRPWVSRAAVAVVPLRIARGVQNKLLEALAMARPVVASRTCLAGLATQPGKHLLASETPDEWVEQVAGLLDDSDHRRRLGSAGRAFVEEHHCWDRTLAPLRELLLCKTVGQAVPDRKTARHSLTYTTDP